MAAVCHDRKPGVKRPPRTSRFRLNGDHSPLGGTRKPAPLRAVELPAHPTWDTMAAEDQVSLIEEIMALYRWTFTREQEVTSAKQDVIGLLEALSGHAAKAREMHVYTWALKMRGESFRRCTDRYALQRWTDPLVTTTWIDCNRRACTYCGPLRTWREVQELAKALLSLDADIYRMEVGKDRARSIVDYSTKRGHITIAVPTGAEETVVYTSMPRKDAHLTWAVGDDGGDPIRRMVLEDLNPDFESQIYRDVSRIPAYRKDDPSQRRMRMNSHFKAALAALKPEDDEKSEEAREHLRADLDADKPQPMPQAAIEFAIVNGMVTDTWPSGEIKTIDTSKVEPNVKHQFLAIMHKRPTPGRSLSPR